METVLLPDGTNVNRALVQDGWCWWYRRYAPGNVMLERIETEAKEATCGLWEDTSRCAGALWFYTTGSALVIAAESNVRTSVSLTSCHRCCLVDLMVLRREQVKDKAVSGMAIYVVTGSLSTYVTKAVLLKHLNGSQILLDSPGIDGTESQFHEPEP